MRILKVTSALAIALLTAAISEQANAVVVVYTLTFTGKSGDRANGTGTLVVDEPAPLNSFNEKSYGDLVSLTANIGGRTYNFAPSSVEVDLGTNQTFHGVTGSSSPGVLGSNGLVGTLVLGGFDFWIINPGAPHLNEGASPLVRASFKRRLPRDDNGGVSRLVGQKICRIRGPLSLADAAVLCATVSRV
jgi:hypothetical protein